MRNRYIADELCKATDIHALLESYGVEIKRNFTKCWVHEGDNTNSMYIKGNFGWCYGCNTRQSAIDIVRHFSNVDFHTSLRILDDITVLGLTKLLTFEEREMQTKKAEELARKRHVIQIRQQYGNYAWNRLCDYFKFLKDNKEKYAGQFDNPLFVEACMNSDYVEYIVDLFMFNTENLCDEIPDVVSFIKLARKNHSPCACG